MKIKAYAKVNLALKVINKREDGYHNLVTIMDLIDIYDEIHISKSNEVIFRCSDKSLENDHNLVVKAINVLKDDYPKCANLGINIYLNKHIPYGAGLGGGSSDAASVLIVLNKIWKLDLTFDELVNEALKLGSDVPFFLLRNLGILSGIGENVNAIDSKLKLYYVLVLPGYPMYTKDVYENNEIYGDDLDQVDEMLDGFNNNDARKVINNIFNDLQASACKINDTEPRIIDIIKIANEYINSKGYLAKAMMSGSGSSVFSVFENRSDAIDAYNYLSNTLGKYKGVTVILTNN